MSERQAFENMRYDMEKVALLGFGGKRQPDEYDQLINQRNEAINQLKTNASKLDGLNPNRAATPKSEVPKKETAKPSAAPKKPVMRDFGEHFKEEPKAKTPEPKVTPQEPTGSRVSAKAEKSKVGKGKLGLLGGAALAGGSLVGLNAMNKNKEREKVAGAMANRFLSKQANEEDDLGQSLSYLGGAAAGVGGFAGVNAVGSARSAGEKAQQGIHPDVDKIMAREATKERIMQILKNKGQFAGQVFEAKPGRTLGSFLGGGTAGALGYQAYQALQEGEEQLASTENRFLSKQADELSEEELERILTPQVEAAYANGQNPHLPTSVEEETHGALLPLAGALGGTAAGVTLARKIPQAGLMGIFAGGLAGGSAGEYAGSKMRDAMNREAFANIREHMDKIASTYR